MTVYNDTMNDGVEINGSALVIAKVNVDIDFYWSVNNTIEVDLSFEWSIGEIPLYWYVIEGYLNPPDATQALAITVPEKQNFIQTILARTPKEVCEYFEREKLPWQIVNIKRYRQPADIYLNDPNVYTNVLDLLNFQCPQFLVSTNAITYIGMSASAIPVIANYIGSGIASFSGSASASITSGGTTPTSSSFSYASTGLVITTGGYGLYDSSLQFDYLTYAGITTYLEQEVLFGLGSSTVTIVPAANTIATACGACTAFPSELYLQTNLENSNIFSKFLQRNNLEFSKVMSIFYNRRLESWLAFQHFVGLSDDNTTDETWRFQFEWSCTTNFGDSTGFPMLKFSMLVTRKNLETGLSMDTRLAIIFTTDSVCSAIRNFKQDLLFDLNTKTKYVTSIIGVVASNVLLSDKIGIFGSTYWQSKPTLSVRISSQNTTITTEMQDISFIVPQNPSVFQDQTLFQRSDTNV